MLLFVHFQSGLAGYVPWFPHCLEFAECCLLVAAHVETAMDNLETP